MKYHPKFEILKEACGMLKEYQTLERNVENTADLSSEKTKEITIFPEDDVFTIPLSVKYIVNVIYYVDYDREEDFNENGYVDFLANEMIIDRIYLKMVPVISRLYRHPYRVSVKHSEEGTTFRIPLMFDLISGGNIFQCPKYNVIQFKALHKGSEPKRSFLICRYLEDRGEELFYGGGNHDLQQDTFSKIFYRHSVFSNTPIIKCIDIWSLSMHLGDIYIPSGIFFAFEKDGKIIKDSTLLKSISFTFGGFSNPLIECPDARECYGKSPDFLTPPLPTKTFQDAKLSSTPFPGEVWAKIFEFCDEPLTLMLLCKFIFNVSRKPTVLEMLQQRFYIVPGWYHIPFLGSFDTCHLEGPRLDLTFSRLIEDISIFCFARGTVKGSWIRGSFGINFGGHFGSLE